MIKERRYYFRKSVDSESVLCYNKARVKRQIMFPIYIYPPVAKLDIAADSDSEGRGFESLRAGQSRASTRKSRSGLFFYYHLALAFVASIYFSESRVSTFMGALFFCLGGIRTLRGSEREENMPAACF